MFVPRNILYRINLTSQLINPEPYKIKGIYIYIGQYSAKSFCLRTNCYHDFLSWHMKTLCGLDVLMRIHLDSVVDMQTEESQ